MVALSVDTLRVSADATGFTHLDCDQARRLRDTLSAALDLLSGEGEADQTGTGLSSAG